MKGKKLLSGYRYKKSGTVVPSQNLIKRCIMKKIIFVILLGVVGFHSCQISGRDKRKVPYVLVIGIDGLGSHGFEIAKTPHMNELMKNGAWTLSARTVIPSRSGPAWSSMITGATVEKHGVGSNGWTVEEKLLEPVFKSDYDTIAVKEKRYELMRFWLLGSWITNKLKVSFELYSLVIDSKEKNIESEFGKHINETENRKYSRITWEQIYGYIGTLKDNTEKQKMIDYFENKTIGFNSSGRIIKAFNT